MQAAARSANPGKQKSHGVDRQGGDKVDYGQETFGGHKRK